jgi:hypothetical protein
VNDQQLNALFAQSDVTGQPQLPPAYLPDLLGQARRSARRRRVAGVLAAAAAVLVVLGVAGLVRPHTSSLPPADRSPGTPTLPHRIAPYSSFTGEVSASPPGPAIMIYEYGSGETINVWQALALSADGDVYRQIDAAEGSGGLRQWLLSPDGRTVIMAERQSATSALLLLDLITGKQREVGLPAKAGVSLLAVSPDGQQVAYTSAPLPDDLRAGNSIEFENARVGTLSILDLTTGRATPVPGFQPVQAAAFSPDGELLAIQSKMETWIITADGVRVRQVPMPADTGIVPRNAWSPDGHLLATTLWRADSWQQLDGTTTSSYSVASWYGIGIAGIAGATEPWVISEHDTFLGWRSSDRVLVFTPSSADNGDDQLADLSLDGTRKTLSRFDTGRSCELGMQTCQTLELTVASGLLPDLTVRPAGSPQRGPWPTSMLLLIGIPITVVAVLIVFAGHKLRRRTVRGRKPAPPPREQDS